MVNLGPANGDWRRGLGRDAVPQAAHVSFGGGDLEVVAGVRPQVGDDGLSQTGVHLHLLLVVLHLVDWRNM